MKKKNLARSWLPLGSNIARDHKKSPQDRPPIPPKRVANFCYPFWEDPRAILERSWAISGRLGRSWGDLGWILASKIAQDHLKSPQDRPPAREIILMCIYIYHLLYMQPSPAACPPRGARRPPIAIALSVGLEHEFLFFRQEYYLGKHSSASG